MENCKSMALVRLEGTYCETYWIGWIVIGELCCRFAGKTHSFSCSHTGKRIAIRMIGRKAYACILPMSVKASETLCPDCTAAARQIRDARLAEIQAGLRMSPEEKERAANQARQRDFVIAAEKATAEFLEDAEIKGSPEKQARLKELLGKVKDWEKTAIYRPDD